MAAQVLNGTGNVSYTNSTGQNVRVVVNYLFSPSSAETTFALGGWSQVGPTLQQTMGKTLAYLTGAGGNTDNNSMMTSGTKNLNDGWPMEFALANGDTFSYTSTGSGAPNFRYNIIIIPEAG